MNKELVFEGNPKQIGLQHGQALRDDIVTTIRTYSGMWGFPKEKIPRAVSGFRKIIEGDYPHLAEEISGIAEGSSIEADFIYAINARTELLRDSAKECTSVGVPASAHNEEHVILAQNWDWYSHFRDLVKVVEIRPNRKARMKMFIEPGMVGKIGMNEAGLGVCMNFLLTEQIDENGVPVHFILRNILECDDFSSAKNYVYNVKKAASTYYLIGHKGGEIAGLETRPEDVVVTLPNPLISHTNSYTARGESCLRNKWFDFSASRFIADNLDEKISTDEVNRTLGRVRFPRASVLEQYFFNAIRDIVEKSGSSERVKYFCDKFGLSYTSLLYGRSETVRKINIDLTEGSLAVSLGARSELFTVYQFH